MNPEMFVDAIREVVVESFVKSVQSNLYMPPGRKPSEKTLRMSRWYNSLNDGEKSILLEIIRESVEIATFVFLCVLDGAQAFEGQDKGELSLYYKKRENTVLLNDPNGVSLHELL